MQDITPPNYHRPFEEGLKIISHCPICHFRHNSVEAKILEENDNAHLIYIKCQRCQTAVLALFSTNNFGISSVGLITDFDSQEVAKFKESAKVNSDDVLIVREQLEKNVDFFRGFC